MSTSRDDLSDWPRPPRRAPAALLTVVGILLLLPAFCTLGLLIDTGISPADEPSPLSGRMAPAMIGSLLSGAVGMLLCWLARRNRMSR